MIPTNGNVTVIGVQLYLEEPQAPWGMRHTIDVFLRSPTADMEENAIAVILSGTGADDYLSKPLDLTALFEIIERLGE